MTVRDILKITLTLVIIYLAGGVILASVYSVTSPVIYKLNKMEKEQALKEMMPDAEKIEKLGDWTLRDKPAEYFVAKKGDDAAGYIVQSYGKGFGGYITLLVAIDKDLRIQKVKILSHKETPGFIENVDSERFMGQFKGKGIDNIKLVKVETTEYIQAVTGATVSSRGVATGARDGLIFLIDALKGGIKNETPPKG